MYQDKFPLLQKFIDAYNGDNPPEHLIFGDSVALRVASDDADKRTLEEMVSSRLGKDNVCYISESAFNAHIYSMFCSAISRVRHKPRSVIIPINIRSFSPSWDLDPKYQFLWETDTLDDFAKGVDQLRPPIKITPVAQEVYRAIPVNFLSTEPLTIGYYLDVIGAAIGPGSKKAWNDRLRDIFEYFYCHKIYSTHRKLQYLESAVKTLRSMDIGVGLYITPINYCAGRKYVGRAFGKRVSSNVKFIERYLKDIDVVVVKKTKLQKCINKEMKSILVNLVFENDDTNFFKPHNATEHLRCDARNQLSLTIAEMGKVVSAIK